MFLSVRKKLPDFMAWYKGDKSGSVAIEFAFILPVFLAMLFGQIAVGLFFFSTFTLEFAIEEAGRQVRTGQAQEMQMTQELFKNNVCDRLPGYMDCDINLRVNVFPVENFSNVNIPPCLDDAGALVQDPDPDEMLDGPRNSGMLVIACYEWPLAGVIPLVQIGNMNNGSTLIRAVTVFHNEPF